MVMRGINEQESFLIIFGPSQYISRSYVITIASYINQFDKETYMWVGIFCPCGRTKKTNAHVLKDVTSILSNSTRPSNSTQQWGLKPPGEELVKDEIINYNEA
jgi:hypothetical protein